MSNETLVSCSNSYYIINWQVLCCIELLLIACVRLKFMLNWGIIKIIWIEIGVLSDIIIKNSLISLHRLGTAF